MLGARLVEDVGRGREATRDRLPPQIFEPIPLARYGEIAPQHGEDVILQVDAFRGGPRPECGVQLLRDVLHLNGSHAPRLACH